MVASGCTLLLVRSTAALAHKNDETESMGPPTRLAHVSTPRHNYFQCDLSGDPDLERHLVRVVNRDSHLVHSWFQTLIHALPVATYYPDQMSLEIWIHQTNRTENNCV